MLKSVSSVYYLVVLELHAFKSHIIPIQVLHFLNGEIQKTPQFNNHADRIIFNVSGKRFETTFECLNG